MNMTRQRDIEILPSAMRAMADPTRLKILLMLEGEPRTVGQIVSFFNLSQPTITRHLQTLSAAGLVIRKRQGQQVVYQLNAENLKSICVDLVASFPCCCITIKPHHPTERTAKKPGKRSEHAHIKKKNESKPKGDRP